MPLNTLSQIFNTTAIKAIPNQNNNLLDFVGTSGTTVASVTAGGVLDLRASSGTILGEGSSVIGNKIQLWANTYGIGIQGSRLVIYNDSTAATSIRTSLTGSDIIRFNNDGNLSTRYVDSLANSGAYFDMGVGTAGIIAVNRSASHVPLTIRGAISQSVNLQEWQSSSSVVLSSITSAGVFAATQGVTIDSSGGSISLGGTTGGTQYLNSIIFNSSNSTNPVHRILWQGGGTGNSNWEVGTNTGLQTNKNFLIRYTENSPVRDYVPLRIQGTDGTTILSAFSGQTANIQEWRDSSSTVLANVDVDGKAYFTHSSTNTGTFGVEGNLRLRNRNATDNNYSLIEAESSSGGITSGIQFITTNHTNSYGRMIVGTRSAAGFNSAAFTVESGGGITTALNTASTIGLVVKGAVSQSANLQEWQNSAGTVLSKINQVGSGVFGNGALNAIGNLNAFSSGTTVVPLVVQGVASQTADLQQWQSSSGSTLAKITSDGKAAFGDTSFTSGIVSITAVNATDIPLSIRASSLGQSANLTQWISFTGSTVASINNDGKFVGDGSLLTNIASSGANEIMVIMGAY
jgi:hypothetical protein